MIVTTTPTKRYLFVGEESYRLHKELQRRSDNFVKKYGPDTVVSLSLEADYTPGEIMQALMSGGLFAEHKLIIIHDIPWSTTSKAGTAELEELMMAQRDRINPDYFLILVASKPDKRKSAYKFFKKHCELKEFKPMDMRSLPKFLKEEFDLYNTSTNELTRDLINHLVELVGTDGRRLSHEIKKLTHYLNATQATLDSTLMNRIVASSAESNAFDVLEHLVKDQPTALLDSINTLNTSWAARQQAQWWILRGLKTLNAYLITLATGGDKASLGLSPFVTRRYDKRIDKLLSQREGFQELYSWLIDYEYRIKTWQADPEWYWIYLKSLLYNNHFIAQI